MSVDENQALPSFDAIYENGVLRPLNPLPLAEQEKVRVRIEREDDVTIDYEYMKACATEADDSVSLEQVRAALSKIPGSMDEAIDEIRGEY